MALRKLERRNSSCHIYHSKKSIPYSQALVLIEFVQKICFSIIDVINLSAGLKIEVTYNEKVLRQQILKARKFTRNYLLNQGSKTKGRNKHKLVFNFTKGRNKHKLVFNFTYHPAYSKSEHILSNINLLFTPDAQHRKVFPEVSIVGFKVGLSGRMT